MISPEGLAAGPEVAVRVQNSAEEAQKKQDSSSTVGNLVDGASLGLDGIDLAARGCKAVADRMSPDHVTGGVEAPAGFVTGGGDGPAKGFQTAADCDAVPEVLATTTESAGLISDAGSMGGDLVSGAADLVGGIIGGIFEGI